MAGVLVVATVSDGSVTRSSLELIEGARALGAGLEPGLAAVVLGSGPGVQEGARALAEYGVSRSYKVESPALEAGQTDAFLAAAEAAVRASGAEIVLISADTVGRDLAPRLAHRIGAALLAECVELEMDGEAVVGRRQVYGGRAIATAAASRRPVVVSVKPRAMDVPKPAPTAGEAEDLAVEINPETLPARVLEVLREESDVGLEDAQVVIGGGRGIGGPEGFEKLGELAALLGGAVGASRPPADSGWVPLSWQIGQTGKTIRPALYVAVGISGATQHIAGASGSRTIVAINRDAEAPIFSAAHLGIVADYREVLPELMARIKEAKGK